MTAAFSKPCAHPGCRKFSVSSSSYCAEHLALIRRDAQASADSRRKSSASRGYNSAWRDARLAFLRLHPLCEACLKNGFCTPATDVDHIIPHRGDKELFWNRDNWQALCHECHSRKTASEDGAFGNKKRC